MSQFFQIHPDNPQPRLIKQAVEIIRKGGVVVYPTDSSYAIGCSMGNKAGIERIRRLRQLDDKHNFTLACRDLSQLGLFAKVDTAAFRLLKAHLPGPTRSFSRRRAKCRACCCIPNVAPSGCAYRHCRSPRRCWKSSASR